MTEKRMLNGKFGQALGLDDRKEDVEREVRAPGPDDLAALHGEGRAREGVLDLAAGDAAGGHGRAEDRRLVPERIHRAVRVDGDADVQARADAAHGLAGA